MWAIDGAEQCVGTEQMGPERLRTCVVSVPRDVGRGALSGLARHWWRLSGFVTDATECIDVRGASQGSPESAAPGGRISPEGQIRMVRPRFERFGIPDLSIQPFHPDYYLLRRIRARVEIRFRTPADHEMLDALTGFVEQCLEGRLPHVTSDHEKLVARFAVVDDSPANRTKVRSLSASLAAVLRASTQDVTFSIRETPPSIPGSQLAKKLQARG